MAMKVEFPKSIWADTAPPRRPGSPLEGAIEADTVIVGGGLSGLSAALHLARAGQKTVLLEAMAVGWGASGRNNGQVIPTMTAAEPDAIRNRYGAAGGYAGCGSCRVDDRFARYADFGSCRDGDACSRSSRAGFDCKG